MLDTKSEMLVGELKVRAHVMTLGEGVYCLFLAKNQGLPASKEFPAVKVSLAPGQKTHAGKVSLVSFDQEGWLNEETSALLIKIKDAPAQILVSFYDTFGAEAPLPRLQLLPVGDTGKSGLLSETKPLKAEDLTQGSLLAHIQEEGDVVQPLSEWIGKAGSERWIEGFQISVPAFLTNQDIEYQAVLGKGWLSPWVEGGEFCGSRGMSLPLLGLNVRLKESAAQKWQVRTQAVFIDGFKISSNECPDQPLESPENMPLEAFKVTLAPKEDGSKPVKSEGDAAKKKSSPRSRKAGKK